MLVAGCLVALLGCCWLCWLLAVWLLCLVVAAVLVACCLGAGCLVALLGCCWLFGCSAWLLLQCWLLCLVVAGWLFLLVPTTHTHTHTQSKLALLGAPSRITSACDTHAQYDIHTSNCTHPQFRDQVLSKESVLDPSCCLYQKCVETRRTCGNAA